jgi:hypothetical protein
LQQRHNLAGTTDVAVPGSLYGKQYFHVVNKGAN